MSGVPTIIPDGAGNIDGRGSFLDGSGNVKAANIDGSITPVMLNFKAKNQVAFAPLKLLAPWETGYTPYTSESAKAGAP